ncbi:unnamed protein product [Cuscuta epithymum]|uniref:WRKY domain-containing protein n=1 Tax=Cuscuta epithymum TaxID=186058 RepID=A0AAV0BY16_9ASTE|nr:unnamed protein product [Cuscuta epithymum]
MDGFGGDNVQSSFMGDWMMLSPTSPSAFFSSTKNNKERKGENEEEYISARNNVGDGAGDQTSARFISDQSELKINGGGSGLMERMAARAGFSAPKLNTGPSALAQNNRCSNLPIPPGLSPTSLLDSPVFLSNSMVQSSPTTGKFAFPSIGDSQNSAFFTAASDNNKDGSFNKNDTSSFAFEPLFTEHIPPFDSPTFSKVPPPSISCQSFPASAEPDAEEQDDVTDQRGIRDPNSVNAPTDDGYNWRKYGQKQVRGSEYPRSYYKCTHSNCPVKKKVERSHEGHITEIIYKGAHIHPKPPSNHRSVVGSENAEELDNLETASSGLLGSDYCDGSQTQNGTHYESRDPVDGSSLFSNDEDEDDCGTHGSVSLGYEGEGDELDSKRRKIETYAADMTGGATRAIREPRVVVQTTSEVDILDDGYRWRKYGQKVVKGNPNPRSYYKCTSAGCTVRKHVERASHDLKSVITTYEGKHNHDVPAARNSSHYHNGNTSTSLPPSQNVINVHRPEHSQQQQQRFGMPHIGSLGFHSQPHLGFGFGMMNPQGFAGMFPAYLGQRPLMNGMVVKPEPIMEPGSDAALNLSSNNSSPYQHVTSRLPLGPQM